MRAPNRLLFDLIRQRCNATETCKRKKTNDINLSKNELQEPYNPFLDCDINESSCFQNLVNQHILNNFHYPQLANYFDIQAMVNVNYIIDKIG